MNELSEISAPFIALGFQCDVSQSERLKLSVTNGFGRQHLCAYNTKSDKENKKEHNLRKNKSTNQEKKGIWQILL